MLMALTAGTRLGPYEILAPIGAGGMGEVYRAHDPRVGRDVAIKVSAEQFTERFEREIRAVASLNHSNICTLYDVGPNYLVMELVEGPTLAERIKQGAIPLEESLEIARQIADALEAAHEKGIVHRDLKPANIKIKPDGTVKVLDFGLAKVGGTPAVSSDNSPTLSVAQTAAGVILGTAAYMSPEQAKGKIVDKRADIWAFGCVLYEMLTGRAAFQGEDVSEILASVIKGDVNLDLLPPTLHPDIRKLLSRCLQKDLKKRIRDIGDVQYELGQVGAHPAAAEPAAEGERKSKLRLVLPWVAAAIVLTAIIAAIAAWSLKPSPPGMVMRFPFTLPEGQQFTNASRHMVAISPDGTQFVYLANDRLYLKPMRELGSISIQGTEIAGGVLNPVFSPDGRSLAFFSTTDQAYKRIAVSGGVPVLICRADPPFGMNWGANDQIVIGQGSKGILRVSANGGQPETIVSVKENELAHGPQILPDGDSVLFTLASDAGPNRWNKARIVVQKITSGERKTLIANGGDARYLPTGHIVYMVSGTLLAVPFNLKRLEVTGRPVPIVEDVRRSTGPRGTFAAQFSFSDTGTLVYLPGIPGNGNQRSLALVDRNGSVKAIGLPSDSFNALRISPNGKQLVFGTNDGKESIVWVYELSGKTSKNRLTFKGRNSSPIWSGDGERVLFQSDREGDNGIFWQRADGTGSAERLTKAEEGVEHIPDSWVPNSQSFVFLALKGDKIATWTYSLLNKKATLLIDDPTASVQGGYIVFTGWPVACLSIGRNRNDGDLCAAVPCHGGQISDYQRRLRGEPPSTLVARWEGTFLCKSGPPILGWHSDPAGFQGFGEPCAAIDHRNRNNQIYSGRDL